MTQKNIPQCLKAALFTIAKIRKQPKNSSVDERIKGEVAMEYNGLLFSHRKNEILSFATTQMALEGLVLTEVSQTKINIV